MTSQRIDRVPAPTDDALRARFAALVVRCGGAPDAVDPAAAICDRLLAAWGGSDRRYHALGHLVACLHELDGVAASEPATRADLVELALWYHDAIYEPLAHDCEERSARWLEDDATALGLPAGVAPRAAALVRATAHVAGPAPVGDPATDLMVDIDLSILGADPPQFMAFEHGVEQEYAVIPTATFRAARGRFLASLLATPVLFRTERFRARYEARARAQLADLLNSPRYQPYR